MSNLMPRLFGLACAGLALCAAGCATLENDTAADVTTDPVVRTLKDVEQGKVNVQTVAQELQNLFDQPIALSLTELPKKPLPPPYCEVVSGPDGNATLIYRTRFTTSSKLANALDSVIDNKTLVDQIAERNMVLVQTQSGQIDYYKQLIEALDKPAPQILIEGKIVEVMFSDGMQRDLSLNYNYKNGKSLIDAVTSVPGVNGAINGVNGVWQAITGSNNLSLTFNWLKTAQNAKVLSSPNIMVTRNEIARIVTGQDIPIQSSNNTSSSQTISTSFKRVGVTLEVEPEIINDDAVTLRIYPQVSNVIRYDNITTGSGSTATTFSVPVISVRNVESHLRLYDQQVVMLGGLYDRRDSLQEERIPILSDIPFFGELFTSKNRSTEVTHLLFFIKVHIIKPDQAASNVIYDPAQQKQQADAIGKLVQDKGDMPGHAPAALDLAREMIESVTDLPQKVEQK